MEAVKQTFDWETDVSERPIIASEWRSQRSYSRSEFMDKLAKRLGKHFGLADIREAK